MAFQCWMILSFHAPGSCRLRKIRNHVLRGHSGSLDVGKCSNFFEPHGLCENDVHVVNVFWCIRFGTLCLYVLAPGHQKLTVFNLFVLQVHTFSLSTCRMYVCTRALVTWSDL